MQYKDMTGWSVGILLRNHWLGIMNYCKESQRIYRLGQYGMH